MRPSLMSVIVLIISGFLGIKYLVAFSQWRTLPDFTAKIGRPPTPQATQAFPRECAKNRANVRSEQHSDSSSYWLFDARFILYGGNDIPDEKKSQCWAFKWMNDTKGPPTIYIVVSMNGVPMEIPSI
jgi:hypothetical protein